MMNRQIELYQWTRTNLISLLEPMTHEQLNQIPNGFSNNLIWHAGHIHFVQQYLIYHLCGSQMDLPPSFADKYGSGSRADGNVASSECTTILSLLKKYHVQTVTDMSQDRFQSFTPFSGSYFDVDYHLSNFEEAFGYNNIHEAVHLGYMRSMAKMLGII